MTMQEAVNRMQSEMQWLGISWEKLEQLLEENANAFSYKTIVAYSIIKEAKPK